MHALGSYKDLRASDKDKRPATWVNIMGRALSPLDWPVTFPLTINCDCHSVVFLVF